MLDSEKERKVARRKGLPIPLVISLARQLLSGIEHIHNRSWLHRDLKPANILLGQ